MRYPHPLFLLVLAAIFTSTTAFANPNEPDVLFEIKPADTTNEQMVVTLETSKNDGQALPERKVLYSVAPDDYIWKNGPASFPRGTKYAVLEGDPYGKGSYTIRIQFPPHYRLPAHAHGDVEQVTVMSGVLHIALGDQLKEGEGIQLPAGGFTVLSADENHFEWTGDEGALVQIHGIAPRVSIYADKKNDPTAKKTLQPDAVVAKAGAVTPLSPSTILTVKKTVAAVGYKAAVQLNKDKNNYAATNKSPKEAAQVQIHPRSMASSHAHAKAVSHQEPAPQKKLTLKTAKVEGLKANQPLAMPLKNAAYFTSRKFAADYAVNTTHTRMTVKELASNMRSQPTIDQLDQLLN